MWAFVYGFVPLAVPFLVVAPAARRRPQPAGRPAAARRCACSRRSSASALLVGAIALYVAPVELGEHWLWPLTPLLARAVASWYALFGTMLLTLAIGLRRPSEALIPYATLACWSVLLLVLPLLHPDDVERRRALVRADGRRCSRCRRYALRIALAGARNL